MTRRSSMCRRLWWKGEHQALTSRPRRSGDAFCSRFVVGLPTLRRAGELRCRATYASNRCARCPREGIRPVTHPPAPRLAPSPSLDTSGFCGNHAEDESQVSSNTSRAPTARRRRRLLILGEDGDGLDEMPCNRTQQARRAKADASGGRAPPSGKLTRAGLRFVGGGGSTQIFPSDVTRMAAGRQPTRQAKSG